MKIGQLISEYREEHGLSQRDFARRADLSSAVISFIEKGVRENGEPYIPRLETVRKIARAMGTTMTAITSQCEDYDGLNVPVGIDETPLIEDFIKELQNQSPDEAMLIQAYRLIPIEHRIEAMQSVFNIKDKYANV